MGGTEIAGLRRKSYKTLQAMARKTTTFQRKINGMSVVQGELTSLDHPYGKRTVVVAQSIPIVVFWLPVHIFNTDSHSSEPPIALVRQHDHPQGHQKGHHSALADLGYPTNRNQ
jgi:hypothetical protein